MPLNIFVTIIKMLSLWNEFPTNIYGLGDVAEDIHNAMPMFKRPILKPAGTSLPYVMRGEIDACVTALYYWQKEYPALGALTGIPFGLDPTGMYSWSWSQGTQYLDMLGARMGIKIIPLYFSASQIAGWYKKMPSIHPTARPYKGIRMRSTGYPARIFESLGAQVVTQSLDVSMIQQQLQDGRIDAVEWVDAVSDMNAGWHRYAQYALVPGWHERCSVGHLVVNRSIWDRLKDPNEIMMWSQAYGARTLAEGLAVQGQAYRMLQNRLIRIPQWMLDLMRAEWVRIRASIHDPVFQDICKSMDAFRSDLDVYRSIQMLQH